jgi:hypothetical protein
MNQFYGCGTWDDEGLAEAHDELDGREEDEAEERLLTRLGMSKYYGSEGFDRPPSDVYSYGGGYFGDDGAGVLAPCLARGVSPLARGACVCVCVLA